MNSLKPSDTLMALVKLNGDKIKRSLKYRRKIVKIRGEYDMDEMIKREQMEKE